MNSDTVSAFTVKQIVARPSMWEYMWRRWLGGVIDLVAVVLLVFIVNTLVSFLLVLVWTIAVGTEIDHDVGLRLVIISACISGIAGILYFPVWEGVWGQSVGKLMVGTIVVDETGRPPGIGKAVLRTITRFIEVNPVAAGCLPAAIAVAMSQNRQRLGDMLAGKYVVRLKDLALVDGK